MILYLRCRDQLNLEWSLATYSGHSHQGLDIAENRIDHHYGYPGFDLTRLHV